MNMTATQFNDLRHIANLAYGSGLFEGKSGGNGALGLMRGPNGEPRVFKCLTHSGERSAFAKTGLGGDQLMKASDELKLELKRLATAAGMNEEAVEALFNDVPTGGLLSRKIVARVVTGISQANGGQDVWDGVKGAGTVRDTTLSLVDGAIDLGKYGDKGFRTMEENALAAHNFALATTGTAAAEQIAAGHVGDEWTDAIGTAAAFLGNVLPKCGNNGLDPIAPDLLIANPEGMPLARPTFISMTGHDETALRPQLFQRELTRLLRSHGDEELTPAIRQTIARKALTAAVTEAWVLKTMFGIAKAKGKISDTDAQTLLNEAVWDDTGKLRDSAIRMARDGVRKGMEAQAGHNDDVNPAASLYLRHLYLDGEELDIMAPNAFIPEDNDGTRTLELSRLGLNDALSFTWSELTVDMKAVFAATHDRWEGDPSAYAVPTGQGIYNAPGKLYMTEFWMD